MTKRKTKNKTQSGAAEILLRACFGAGLILLGLNWPRLLAGKSEWMEQHYSEGIYLPIRRAISALTSLVPFSIAEFLLYFLVLGVSALLLVRLIQLVLCKIKLSRLISTLASILLAGGIVLNLFYATWGFNYFREPLAQRMELTIETRSVDELEAFVLKTAIEARTLRETLHEDENGVFAPEERKGKLFQTLTQAYNLIHKENQTDFLVERAILAGHFRYLHRAHGRTKCECRSAAAASLSGCGARDGASNRYCERERSGVDGVFGVPVVR